MVVKNRLGAHFGPFVEMVYTSSSHSPFPRVQYRRAPFHRIIGASYSIPKNDVAPQWATPLVRGTWECKANALLLTLVQTVLRNLEDTSTYKK